MDLDRVVNVDDMRKAARRRLPRMIYDYIEGGAEDEVTLRANREALDRVQFESAALVDVSSRTLTTTITGMEVAAPLVLAPAGLTRIVHQEGERAVARAASNAGIPYVVTPWSSFSIEELAEAASGPLWFEINASPDPELWRSLVKRAHECDYQALVLMVDAPVGGRRERELRRRLIPPRFTLRNIADAARRPTWALGFVRTAHLLAPGSLAEGERSRGLLPKIAPFWEYGAQLSNAAVTWDDLAEIRRAWDRPLAVKGIMSAADGARCAEHGADMVMVSNHGGRQLDGLPSALTILPQVLGAVNGRADVLVDGGIRRGTDIAKALAMGASACLIGRPYHYGLAVAGEAGVTRVIDMLLDELDRTLGLLGCRSVSELSYDHIRRS